MCRVDESMHHTRFHHTNSLICLLLTLLCIQILIDHVCAFVECNQVPWLDLHSRPMKFKRDAILMEVMISIEIFEFNDKYTSMQNGNEIKKAVENPYYLLAVFDAIMNTMTKANGKKVGLVCSLVDRCHFVTYQCMGIFSKSFCTPLQIWMCKSVSLCSLIQISPERFNLLVCG